MNIEILKVTSKEMALEANKFLTKLIQDEKKYDENINENCVVISLYDNFYTNTEVCILLARHNDQYIGYLFGTMIDIGDAYIEKKAKLDALFVDEEYRKNKIGKKLIERGHEIARNLNYHYSVVLGNQKYYSKFNYLPSITYNIKAPFKVLPENFMAIKLNELEIKGIVEYAKEFGI